MAKKIFTGNLAAAEIAPEALAMLERPMMARRLLMPLAFDREAGLLTLVTSRYLENTTDTALILRLIQRSHKEVKSLEFMECGYDILDAGYSKHYGEALAAAGKERGGRKEDAHVTTEQTRLAAAILERALKLGASDIHITPRRAGSSVQYRVDGKLRGSGIVLSGEDELMLCNIYKRSAGLEVNNLVPQDGRFNFVGRSIRLSTMPYGADGVRNKVVLRILASGGEVPTLEELGFNNSDCRSLRRLTARPAGIILVCGPTGEGKTTTQYALLSELGAAGDKVIVTIEDPIERYLDGAAQSQVRDAQDERSRYTFARGLRSVLRQDPDILLVGEIRDAETALTAVQAAQTGHLIFSTLHVRSSVSVFRRLADIGVNVAGFAEQVAGIVSQRLLSLSCPYCAKKIISPLNSLLRSEDLKLLEGGKYSFESEGCEKCRQTGISGRIPIAEIVPFDNYLRDYFASERGLIETERYLREKLAFRSLWDRGLALAAEGKVSLRELLSRLEPDGSLAADKGTAVSREGGGA